MKSLGAIVLSMGILSGVASAGVVVVDAANGPGTDFAVLDAAIANAAPGDVLLLRSGSYPGFTLSGKGLTLIADAGATVRIGDGLSSGTWAEILNVPAGQTAVVRGLDFDIDWGGTAGVSFPKETLTIGDCAGGVVIDRCTIELGSPCLLVYGSPNVSVLDCTFTGFPGNQHAGDRNAGLYAAAGAKVAAVDCVITGSSGSTSEFLPAGLWPAIAGGPGVFAQGACVVTLSRCTVSGAAGGGGLQDGATCEPPADGGAGLLLRADVSGSPLVRTIASSLQGGAAGAAVPCHAPAAAGPAQNVVAGTLLPIAAAPAGLAASSPVREGQTASFAIDGTPGDGVLLLLSLQPLNAFLPAGSARCS